MQLKVDRYQNMTYRRVGKSGLKLSAIGLGFWHNFGSVDPFDQQRAIIKVALDLGITYFDLANNYGPTPGSAEENLGRLLMTDLKPYRDELVIATKAGYHMWEGPYGEWGSKKSIIASADQSLTRLGLDYVDIFYSTAPTQRPRLKKPPWPSTSWSTKGRPCTSGFLTTPAPKLRKWRRFLTT